MSVTWFNNVLDKHCFALFLEAFKMQPLKFEENHKFFLKFLNQVARRNHLYFYIQIM